MNRTSKACEVDGEWQCLLLVCRQTCLLQSVSLKAPAKCLSRLKAIVLVSSPLRSQTSPSLSPSLFLSFHFRTLMERFAARYSVSVCWGRPGWESECSFFESRESVCACVRVRFTVVFVCMYVQLMYSLFPLYNTRRLIVTGGQKDSSKAKQSRKTNTTHRHLKSSGSRSCCHFCCTDDSWFCFTVALIMYLFIYFCNIFLVHKIGLKFLGLFCTRSIP